MAHLAAGGGYRWMLADDAAPGAVTGQTPGPALTPG